MPVSVQSIAKDLGLSKATVSSILSGNAREKGFNTDTIEMVRNYAESLGYIPNLLARGLSTGKSNTVGLIIPAIGDTFYSQITQAIEKPLAEKGYSLIVASSEGDSNKEAKLIQLLRSQKVEGLIIAPSKVQSPEITDMVSAGFPLVLVDRYYPHVDTNYVVVDNEGASRELVRCLIKNGAKKVAILTTDTHLFVMKRRLFGYMSALNDLGIPFDEGLCLSIDRADYHSDTWRQLSRLLATHPDVDGFFMATHYLAMESIRFFISEKIDYNARFKMGCFHSTTALDILVPNMLFSMMPIYEIGEKAVSILMENISEKKSGNTVHITLNNTLL